MALSSAAVLAVYSAGYLRTQAAAERLEAEMDQRRPVLPAPAPILFGTSHAPPPAVETPAPETTAEPASVDRSPEAQPVTAHAPVAVVVPTPPAPSQPAPARQEPAKDLAAESLAEAARAGSPSTVQAAPVAGAPVADAAGVSKTSSGASAPAAVVPATAATEAASIAATDPPAVPPAPAAPRYKDGTFIGWGTSRHGDIAAQVVIAGGRITSASIAECLTRWPCTWIDALPAQVVARQSPETDYVSGATQSTNAFYYAVVQALGKASLP